jgi:hypothetical protein
MRFHHKRQSNNIKYNNYDSVIAIVHQIYNIQKKIDIHISTLSGI